MKTFLLAASVVAATGSALAGIPLGRGELSASVSATATYDSNVFGTPDALADYSATLAPRISYQRQAGLIEASANAGISFIRYQDQQQLDADNLDAGAALRITESEVRNYSGSLSAGYRESNDLNTDLNARISTQSTTYIGRAALITGPRSNLAFNANYADTHRVGASDQQFLTTEGLYDYKDFFYGNSLRLIGNYDELRSNGDNTLGIPLRQNSYMGSVGLGRALAHDTLRAGLSYGYRILNRSAAETSTGERRQSGSVITASLEGPFLPVRYFPKIKSGFALTYQNAATPGLNDSGTKELTGNLRLAWLARARTNVTFTANRSQRLSADDLTVVSTNLQLGLDQTLRYNLTGTLTAGYDWSAYRTLTRQDRTLSFSAGLKYQFAKVWDTRLAYNFNAVTSSERASTYDRHVVSLSLSYQY